MKKNKISIGTFSQVTRLSKKALRIYDEKNLLVPEKNFINNYRYYNEKQFEKGLNIKELIDLDFNLKEIKEYFKYKKNNNSENLNQLFIKKLNQTNIKIDFLSENKKILLEKLNNKKQKKMKYKIIKKTIPEQRVLYMKGKGKLEIEVPKLFGKICPYLYSKENHISPVEISGPAIFLCSAKEYNENLPFEIALPISGQIKETEKIKIKKLPEQEMLTTIHKGKYNQVGQGYAQIVRYANENNLKLELPSRENYLNDPKETPEEELLTEIQFPYTKK